MGQQVYIRSQAELQIPNVLYALTTNLECHAPKVPSIHLNPVSKIKRASPREGKTMSKNSKSNQLTKANSKFSIMLNCGGDSGSYRHLFGIQVSTFQHDLIKAFSLNVENRIF
jgi:hypothetical protein